MSLESEILEIVQADATVAAIPGVIFRLRVMAEKDRAPAVVINRIAGGRESALDMDDYFESALIQLDCIGRDYEQSKELSGAVKGALHGYKGPAGGYTVEAAALRNETDLGSDVIERTALDFSIVYL